MKKIFTKRILSLLLMLTVIANFGTAVGFAKEKCADGHKFSEYSVETEPTYEKEGSEVRICEVCGEKEARTIPKLVLMSVNKCKIKYSGTYTYTGSKILPTVTVKYENSALTEGKDYTVTFKNNKKIGKASLTVTGMGAYEGKVTKYFSIVPAKVKGVKLSSPKFKAMKVSWSKVSKADGYLVKFSTSKNFKNPSYKTVKNKTSVTLYGQKSGGKYNVKIKAFVLKNGEKIYGKYSSVKKVTLKKTAHKESQKNVICLTFDDGPSSNVTPKILDTLKKNNIKATFFIINYSKENTKIIKRIIKEGHTIGIHSYSHDYAKIYSSKSAYISNYKKLYNKLKKDFGYKAKIIRFPGGSSNTVSCNYCNGVMTQLTKYFDKKGIRYFDWNAFDGDANGVTEPVSTIIYNAKSTLSKGRTNVMLCHDSASKTTTAAALQTIIDYGFNNGYIFEPITDKTPQIKHSVAN